MDRVVPRTAGRAVVVTCSPRTQFEGRKFAPHLQASTVTPGAIRFSWFCFNNFKADGAPARPSVARGRMDRDGLRNRRLSWGRETEPVEGAGDVEAGELELALPP